MSVEQTTDRVGVPSVGDRVELAACLDAMRWSALTSADTRSLQAPFRSGADIRLYPLEPVWRSLSAPRVNQLLADDVGLGKTVEAGLVASELILRHRAERVMVVCPAGLTAKWQSEMFDLFGLYFTIVNAQTYTDLRRERGNGADPFGGLPAHHRLAPVAARTQGRTAPVRRAPARR